MFILSGDLPHQSAILRSFSCLTAETEKYVNENNEITSLMILKHSIVDHREQKGTKWRFNRAEKPGSLSHSVPEVGCTKKLFSCSSGDLKMLVWIFRVSWVSVDGLFVSFDPLC